jgi:hypothetical protein
VKPHNALTLAQKAKVENFLKRLGPYQSDVWSNSYYSEILEHIEKLEKNSAARNAQAEWDAGEPWK